MIHGDAMYYDVVMARNPCDFRVFILGDFHPPPHLALKWGGASKPQLPTAFLVHCNT